MKRCFLNERLKNIFLKNRDMRFIKMTGGLGNQMFIYAFYMQMKKHYINTRIDLSDMVHYKAHNGYEMHRVFNLPPIEFRINQPLKRLLNFSFSRKSMNASKSRQVLFHMIKSISGLYYISKVSISRNVFLPTWQTIYARLLHSIRACPTGKQRKCPNR